MFRVGLDKIDNTGHEKMICPDLYRTIVEFVPLANLRLLSDASPIFDTIIKQVGRKIFYYRDRLTDLTVDNYVIIESQFGQKCILKIMKDCYNDIYSGNIMFERTIVRKRSNNDQKKDISKHAVILYDPRKKVKLIINGNCTTAVFEPIYSRRIIDIVNIYPVTNICNVSYIDMNTKIYKYDEFNTGEIKLMGSQLLDKYIGKEPKRVYYGCFKILYDSTSGVWAGPEVVDSFC